MKLIQLKIVPCPPPQEASQRHEQKGFENSGSLVLCVLDKTFQFPKEHVLSKGHITQLLPLYDH